MSDLIERLSKVEDSEREEWISRQEASFIRGGMGEDAAHYLAERYYEIYLRKDELDQQVHIPGTPVIV